MISYTSPAIGIAPQFLSGYLARKTGPAVRPPQHDPLASAIRAAVLAERKRLGEHGRTTGGLPDAS